MRLERFQMIDVVEAFDREAQTLRARSRVPRESPVFEGHFPGHPIMPGVLLIETMAQASGYLLLGLNGFSVMPFLAGVKMGKLRTFIAPESELVIDVSLVHDGSGFAVTEGRITMDGKKACDANLTIKTLAFPAPELEQMMLSEARRIGLLTEAD